MKVNYWIIILIALLGLGIFFLLQTNLFDGEPSAVPIESNFGSKIVYTTDIDADPTPFINHCEDIGGSFNQCGSICEPGADVCASVCAYTCEDIPANPMEIDTSNWSTFSDADYNFSLKYPASDWNMEVDKETSFSPMFNFYIKQAGVPLNLPLNHFVNVSHISVYPEGIPTEGVFGETREFDLDTPFRVTADSRIYTLEDGTPFAAFIKPESPPDGWNESGFIWMRLRIDNLETSCIRDGERMDENLCDPLGSNDQIVRSGDVNEDTWALQQTVLQTINLSNGPNGEVGTNLIKVSSPLPNETIQSPLTIEGRARGQWYFEATFPVVLTNWDGLIIAESYAQTEGDWMTEDFVPFEATLNFDSPYSEEDPSFMKYGSLILQKSNPSGLPENDDALEMRVEFTPEG